MASDLLFPLFTARGNLCIRTFQREFLLCPSRVRLHVRKAWFRVFPLYWYRESAQR